MLKLTGSKLLSLVFLHLISSAYTLAVNVGQDQVERASILNLVTRQADSSPAIAVTQVGRFTVECSGEEDGSDLKVENCEDALEGFSNARKPFAFGPQGYSVDIHTPIRILSREYIMKYGSLSDAFDVWSY